MIGALLRGVRDAEAASAVGGCGRMARRAASSRRKKAMTCYPRDQTDRHTKEG